METQAPLPPEYTQAESAELDSRIAAVKNQLGSKLCVLGHHYQRDEVIKFADFTGDSLKLSQLAAGQTDAEFIVFCGVHFMAESADIVSSPNQKVVLPNLHAGCAMAEMADAEDVAAGLEEISELADAQVTPISYVNSTADIKAITARAGGACCTSSNVRNVFEWALAPADKNRPGAGKIFCIPDQHLGRNTAIAMGYGENECCVYDPQLPDGGLTQADVQRATFILWKGHCYVHQLFRPEHVTSVRESHPDIRVIVHPECPREVVELADASGSTAQIITAIEAADPGTEWAVGTESNLVNRLAKRHTDKFICVLNQASAACTQMCRIDRPHLLWALDGIANGQIVNQITVPKETADNARIALQRMIDIKPVTQVTKNG
ncbi:MAG: quinolinate synthase NadA [Phycisphaerae bacterium]|jgi:quinolinate synthase|nr:quinolinate synthase NadA [Phycisphaerae bacterium]